MRRAKAQPITRKPRSSTAMSTSAGSTTPVRRQSRGRRPLQLSLSGGAWSRDDFITLAMFMLGSEYKYKYDMIEELVYTLKFIHDRLQPHEVRPKFWIGNRLVTLGDWNT